MHREDSYNLCLFILFGQFNEAELAGQHDLVFVLGKEGETLQNNRVFFVDLFTLFSNSFKTSQIMIFPVSSGPRSKREREKKIWLLVTSLHLFWKRSENQSANCLMMKGH
eukprot:TRINITY_DN5397_c0_g2_i3.p1 TRINITY_DN5397_c0_g2~~TRINITY_DN5397_c0_g2_i3.p1  ORF type:complete len:110 (-),score=22.64 TRINITY_DN5397_c0_g2_i3:134-463(-)